MRYLALVLMLAACGGDAFEAGDRVALAFVSPDAGFGTLLGEAGGRASEASTDAGLDAPAEAVVEGAAPVDAAADRFASVDAADATTVDAVVDKGPDVQPEDLCKNGRPDTGEVDIDCGGICPTKCGCNKRCRSDDDCGTAGGHQLHCAGNPVMECWDFTAPPMCLN